MDRSKLSEKDQERLAKALPVMRKIAKTEQEAEFLSLFLSWESEEVASGNLNPLNVIQFMDEFTIKLHNRKNDPNYFKGDSIYPLMLIEDSLEGYPQWFTDLSNCALNSLYELHAPGEVVHEFGDQFRKILKTYFQDQIVTKKVNTNEQKQNARTNQGGSYR